LLNLVCNSSSSSARQQPGAARPAFPLDAPAPVLPVPSPAGPTRDTVSRAAAVYQPAGEQYSFGIGPRASDCILMAHGREILASIVQSTAVRPAVSICVVWPASCQAPAPVLPVPSPAGPTRDTVRVSRGASSPGRTPALAILSHTSGLSGSTSSRASRASPCISPRTSGSALLSPRACRPFAWYQPTGERDRLLSAQWRTVGATPRYLAETAGVPGAVAPASPSLGRSAPADLTPTLCQLRIISRPASAAPSVALAASGQAGSLLHCRVSPRANGIPSYQPTGVPGSFGICPRARGRSPCIGSQASGILLWTSPWAGRAFTRRPAGSGILVSAHGRAADDYIAKPSPEARQHQPTG